MRREGSKLDTGSYSAAFHACEQASEWTSAFDLLSNMKREGVDLEPISEFALISACKKHQSGLTR